jgi:hypothetical protein
MEGEEEEEVRKVGVTDRVRVERMRKCEGRERGRDRKGVSSGVMKLYKIKVKWLNKSYYT